MSTYSAQEAGRAQSLTARLRTQPRELAALVSSTAAPVLDEMSERLRDIQPLMAHVPDLSTSTAILADPQRRFEWPKARADIREASRSVAHDTARLSVHRTRLRELIERIETGARICQAVADYADDPGVIAAARTRAMDLQAAIVPALQTIAALDLVLTPVA